MTGPDAARIVKPYCAAHGIPYYETGVVEGYREILRSMHRVSAPLRGPNSGESPITLSGVDMDQLIKGITLS